MPTGPPADGTATNRPARRSACPILSNASGRRYRIVRASAGTPPRGAVPSFGCQRLGLCGNRAFLILRRKRAQHFLRLVVDDLIRKASASPRLLAQGVWGHGVLAIRTPALTDHADIRFEVDQLAMFPRAWRPFP